jgi:hypothetical protein
MRISSRLDGFVTFGLLSLIETGIEQVAAAKLLGYPQCCAETHPRYGEKFSEAVIAAMFVWRGFATD